MSRGQSIEQEPNVVHAVRKKWKLKDKYHLTRNVPSRQKKGNEFRFQQQQKKAAVTRIRTWATAATTQGPNH